MVRQLFYEMGGLPAGSLDSDFAQFARSEGFAQSIFGAEFVGDDLLELEFAGFASTSSYGSGPIRWLILHGITRDIHVREGGILGTYLPYVSTTVSSATYMPSPDPYDDSLDEFDLGTFTWALTQKDPVIGTWLYMPPVAVPTPPTLMLLGLGLVGIGLARRRKAL